MAFALHLIVLVAVMHHLLQSQHHGGESVIVLGHAGGTYAQQAASLATPLDILVATPQKLLQHAEKGNVYYGDVQYVVLDEADTMFDRGFGPEVEKVLGPLRSKPEPAHCILVAATLTKVWPLLAANMLASACMTAHACACTVLV